MSEDAICAWARAQLEKGFTAADLEAYIDKECKRLAEIAHTPTSSVSEKAHDAAVATPAEPIQVAQPQTVRRQVVSTYPASTPKVKDAGSVASSTRSKTLSKTLATPIMSESEAEVDAEPTSTPTRPTKRRRRNPK